MANQVTNRYSDEELETFRQVIIQKYEAAKSELEDLRSQIVDLSESMESEFGTDYIDDSSAVNELELMNNMAIRKRNYIQDLENAVIRVKNKTYGICSVTGELIDKKRLMAVPTTTKSLEGKEILAGLADPAQRKKAKAAEEAEKPKKKRRKSAQRKVITTVVKRSAPGKARPVLDDEEDDEDGYDDDFDMEDAVIPGVDKSVDIDSDDMDVADEGSDNFDEDIEV
jgi:RNA polymerase-binding transcription factor DksA